MTTDDEEPVQVFIASPEVCARIEGTFWMTVVESGQDPDKFRIISNPYVPKGQVFVFPNGIPDPFPLFDIPLGDSHE